MAHGHFIRRLSLTHRLAALTLVAALPGLIALAYNAFDISNSRAGEVRSEALRNAQFVVSEIDQIFDGIEGVLSAVAQASEARTAEAAICSDYLWRVFSRLESLTSIIIANADGSIRCFGGSATATPNLSDRDYFREAVENRKFVVGSYTQSRLADRKIIPVALPILNGDIVDGVVLAGLNLNWFGARLKERGVAKGASVSVVDRNGIVVSREPFPERYVGTASNALGIEFLRAPAADVREVETLDGVTRIVGFVPPSKTSFGLLVTSGLSREEALAQINRALRNSIVLFAIGSLVAILLAWIVGDSIIRRPLMRMVAAANSYKRSTPAVAGAADEFGFLDRTFDHLLEENAAREEERDTAEARREILVHELAHRVKNTLATVQAIAAISFRQSQGAEALLGFQERLQALVRGHDLLTRKDWKHADMAEVVAAAVAPVNQAHGHRITYSGPAVDLPPTTAVPMAMILHELCTNAMKYGALSDEHGRIKINWDSLPGDDDRTVSLIWSEENGPHVVPPSHDGFGTKLISNLARQMKGSFEPRYAPSGFVCHLKLVSPKFEPHQT